MAETKARLSDLITERTYRAQAHGSYSSEALKLDLCYFLLTQTYAVGYTATREAPSGA